MHKSRRIHRPHNAPSPPPPRDRTWIILAGAGLFLRFALAGITLGTNDAATFKRYGDEISHRGLFAAYVCDPDMTFPPIPAMWQAAAYRITEGRSDRAFCFVTKLPTLLADCAVVGLIAAALRRRTGNRPAWMAAAGYAWCLDAILVSGFHCNTDPIYACLVLFAVYLIQDRHAFFRAGIALGAAINVKLIPVLLVLPLLAVGCRRWRDASRFLGGLALCAMPFLPLLLGPEEVRRHFRETALSYNSFLCSWGVNFILLHPARPHGGFNAAAVWYYSSARYLIFALVVAWALIARFTRRWNLYDVAAVTLCLFLIFAGGFGVQYTVIVVPLMFVTRPLIGVVYGLVAGIFLAMVYCYFWTGDFPPISVFRGDLPMHAAWVGLVAWGTLSGFVIVVLRQGPKDRTQ